MTRDLALTLAGGGNRTFYQIGLLRHWWPALAPRLGAMATCSAGACAALMILTGREAPTFAFWEQRRGRVDRNLDWRRLLRGERLTPHYPVYRDTLLFAMAEGGFERVQAMPFPVLVLVARPPHALPVPLAIPIGLGAYSVERWLHPGRLHPGIGRRLGFEPDVRDLRHCATPGEAADLIIASSATPPFTPVGSVGGRAVLDGGLVDNAPAFAADALGAWARHLVILTRRYPAEAMGYRGHRWYLCPSVQPPADRWDYTRPARITATIALGESDAARRRAELDRWLNPD
ncbi:MAG: patatin-like phospholipase family protein [Gemmatimonadales bacterium]